MLLEFISPKGMYQPHHVHMADNDALCDWTCIGQEHMRIVHDHFVHYLNQC
jgi:hypothetical protein